MDEVGSFMADLGLDISSFNKSLDKAFGDAQTKGEKAGKLFAQSVMGAIASNIPGGSLLANIVGSGDVLRVGAGAIIGSGIAKAALAASDSAAEIQSYRRSLVGISGDAQVAEKALVSLQKIAGKTSFDTGPILALGVRLAGNTGDVDKAAKMVGNIVDAAASFNVQPGNFEDFQKNLSDFQTVGDAKAQIRDVREFLRSAPLAISRIAQVQGVSNPEARKQIFSATGDELLELIRKVGEKNKGAAEAAASQTPQDIAKNFKDTIGQALAPTGEIINKALLPVFGVGLAALSLTADFNRALGGVPLLTVGLIGAGVAAKLVVPSMISVVRGALTLAPSLVALAASANRAALSLSLIAQGGIAGAAGRAAGGAASGAAATAVGGASAGLIARFTAGLLPLLPGLAVAALTGIIAIGGHAIGDNLSGSPDAGVRRVGRSFTGIGTGAAVGGALGALFGTVIPGLGTVVGAAVGTAVGTVIGGGIGALSKDIKKSEEQKRRDEEGKRIRAYYDDHKDDRRDFFGNLIKDTTPLQENTQAIKESTREFRDVKGFAFGGGDRTRGTTSQIELEYGIRGFVRGIV